MNTTTERQYISDSEAYAVFVGSITPQEFVRGFEEFECPELEAVRDFLRNFPFDEVPPPWLEDALYRYLESQLDAEYWVTLGQF